MTAQANQQNRNEALSNATTQNEALDCILTRSSVRRYNDREIPRSVVECLLRAAMAAPTAGNRQPWAFVLIDDPEIKNKIADFLQNGHMMRTAPIAIAVLGDLERAYPGVEREYWVLDTSAASENILLAAHALGLGGVWCGIYPVPERVDTVSRILNLPEHLVPLSIIPLGYPLAPGNPRDKWDPSRIYFNTYR